MNPRKDFRKFRWFVTKSKKLVIGGKSAEQNEALLLSLLEKKQDYVVMHTSLPGSPFSVILSPISKVNSEDLEETAVFTACFSQQWKSGKSKADVDIFKLSEIHKPKKLKTGTFVVKTKLKRKKVSLKLALSVQRKTLRAVPEKSAKKSLLEIVPGKTPKEKQLKKISEVLKGKFSNDEILSALPPGGIQIK
jgi:hypothetical protein